GFGIKTESCAQAWYAVPRELVLLADEVGDCGPQPWIAGYELCPLRSVPLEVLDSRAEWRLASERECFQECEISLFRDVLGGEPPDSLTRLGDQHGGASLDQIQQRLGAPGGHAAEDLVARQQVIGHRRAFFRRASFRACREH